MSEAYYFGVDNVCPSIQYQRIKLKDGSLADLKRIDFQKIKQNNNQQIIQQNNDEGGQNIEKTIFTEKFSKDVPKFLSISCGQKFATLTDYFHNLWIWGQGSDGQLGQSEILHNCKNPMNLSEQLNKKFCNVKCGQNTVFCITDDKKQLYAWGDSKYNKLAKPQPKGFQQPLNIFEQRLLPTIKEFEQEIINYQKSERKQYQPISYNNSIMQKENENFSPKNKSTFRQQQQQSIVIQNQESQFNISEIQDLFIGQNHCYIKINNVFITFGRDKNGRMGIGNIEEQFVYPTIMKQFYFKINIVGISVAKHHCLAWDMDGSAFTWGDGLDGRLGHPIEDGQTEFSQVELYPRKLKQLADQFIIGGVAGNNQTIALNRKGHIFQWGKGEYSNQMKPENLPSIIEAVYPKELKQNYSFVKVAGGYTHFAAIDCLGQLWTWGDCSEGCLGIINNNQGQQQQDQLEPQLVKSFHKMKVVDVGCGDKFTVVLTMEKKSKYESKETQNFKENIQQVAIKQSKVKGRVFDSSKVKNQPDYINSFRQNEKVDIEEYSKWFQKHFGNDDLDENMEDLIDEQFQDEKGHFNSDMKEDNPSEISYVNQTQFINNRSQISTFQEQYSQQLNFILNREQKSNNTSFIIKDLKDRTIKKLNLDLNRIENQGENNQSQLSSSKIYQSSDRKMQKLGTQILRQDSQSMMVNNVNINSSILQQQQSNQTSSRYGQVDRKSSLPQLVSLQQSTRGNTTIDILENYHKNKFLVLPNIKKNMKSQVVIQMNKQVDQILDLEDNNPYFQPIEEIGDIDKNKKSLIEQDYNYYNDEQLYNFQSYNLDKKKKNQNYDQVYDKMGKISKSLTGILHTNNDLLKYEYIELVKNGKEDQHLNYLMQNPEEKGAYTKEQIKLLLSNKSETEIIQANINKVIQQARDISEVEKLPTKQSIQKQIKNFDKRFGEGILGQKDISKIRKMMQNKTLSPTSKQKLAKIQEQAYQRDQKINQAIEFRQQQYEEKIELIKQKQIKRSKEYRDQLIMQKKQKEDKIIKQKPIFFTGNVINFASLLKNIAIQSTINKQNMFKYNIKATAIQKRVRKWLMRLKIINQIKPSVQKLLKRVVIKHNLNKRIKIKEKAASRIRLYFFQEQFKKKMRAYLITYINNIKNCQRFFQWCEKYMNHQVGIVRNMWDNHLLNPHGPIPMFKIGDSNWAKEVSKHLNLKQEIQKKNQKGKNPLDYPEKLRLIPSFMPNTYDTKQANFQSVQATHKKKNKKQSYESSQQQINSHLNSQLNTERMITLKSQDSLLFDNMLLKLKQTGIELDIQEGILPFTKHYSKIVFNSLRLKFGPDHLHREIIQKVIKKEEQVTEKYLKKNIINQRKQYRKQMEKYKHVLFEFIEKHDKEIKLERARLLLLTDIKDLRVVQKREENERKKLEMQSNYSYTNNNHQMSKFSPQDQQNNNLKFLSDHLPFGSQIMVIADRLYQEKVEQNPNLNWMNKPVFKLKLDYKVFEVVIKQIYDDLNIYYNRQIKEEDTIQRKRKKDLKMQLQQQSNQQSMLMKTQRTQVSQDIVNTTHYQD